VSLPNFALAWRASGELTRPVAGDRRWMATTAVAIDEEEEEEKIEEKEENSLIFRFVLGYKDQFFQNIFRF